MGELIQHTVHGSAAATQEVYIPRLWKAKSVSGGVQGHIKAVAETRAESKFLWASPCKSHSQLPGKAGHTPDWGTLCLHWHRHHLEVCL